MTSVSALNVLGSAAATNAGIAASATASVTVLGFAASSASDSSGGSSSGSIFSTIASANDSSAIQNILSSAQTQQSKTAVYANIANYLSALQSGQIEPTATWQTNAAYLQQTGQPFVVTLDSKGQPQITPESQADLSKYPPAQQKQLQTALQQVATMAQKIQANTTNETWLNNLSNVETSLLEFRAGLATPSQGFASNAATLQATGIPFKVVLDASGNLSVENQFQGQFADASTTDQPKLLAAAAQLQTTLNTGFATTAWEAQALTYSNQQQDYYLAVDDTTGGIVVKTNSADNIVPSFLKTDPYPDIGATTPALQQAATLIKQGTGFYLDIGSNGQIVVRQNNSQGINTWNQSRNQAVQNPIVNLLA